MKYSSKTLTTPSSAVVFGLLQNMRSIQKVELFVIWVRFIISLYPTDGRIPTNTPRVFHVETTRKQRGNNCFHVVSTWNTGGVFVAIFPISEPT